MYIILLSSVSNKVLAKLVCYSDLSTQTYLSSRLTLEFRMAYIISLTSFSQHLQMYIVIYNLHANYTYNATCDTHNFTQ